MTQCLYRKYRPKSFEELTGHNSLNQILRNSFIHDKLSHAYLFSGPRGTGKTSTALLLGRLMNCLNVTENIEPCGLCANCESINKGSFLDIVELDAASHNGIDDIRQIVENVQYLPAKGKKKVYIIDEVHMLSKSASNALLKTLEEPPKHIVFILATTELQKILPTIISRCQSFEFRRISIEDIIKRMKTVCEKESIKISDSGLRLIATHSQGGLRDALSILDQAVSMNVETIDVNNLTEILGLVEEEVFQQMYQYIIDGNVKGAIQLIHQLEISGKDLIVVCEQYLEFLRNCLYWITTGENPGFTAEFIESSKTIHLTEQDILFQMEIFCEVFMGIYKGSNTKILIESIIFRLCRKCSVPVTVEVAQPEPQKIKQRDEVQQFAPVFQVEKQPKQPVENFSSENKTLSVSLHQTVEVVNKNVDNHSKQCQDKGNHKQFFEEILKILQKNNPRLKAFLLPASVESINENELILVFGSEFNFHFQNATKANNIDELNKILKEVADIPVTVKMLQRSDFETLEKSENQKIVKSENDNSHENHEVLDKILHMFNGKIIKIEEE